MISLAAMKPSVPSIDYDMVGNIGGREYAESLAPDMQKLLISSGCRPLVRKEKLHCVCYAYTGRILMLSMWTDGKSEYSLCCIKQP